MKNNTKLKASLLILFLLFVASLFAQTAIVDSGVTWSYLYTTTTPPNDAQGDTWKQLNFDDSGWGSGPSSLGNDHSPTTTITVDGDER